MTQTAPIAEPTPTPTDAAPALSVEGLRFAYRAREQVVVDVHRFALARGEQVLLTGGSGAGKSTLLQLIAGLLDPDAGRVLINGADIHAMRGAARDQFRGRSLGFIFQTFNLLHGFSALENVMAALMFSDLPRGQHRARAAELLTTLGIERQHADPTSMSVGQQQRVAVARAVACAPALVLADEPTASLDPENGATAIGLIQDACRRSGAALLCVSHDPALADRFARRARLDDLTPARSA